MSLDRIIERVNARRQFENEFCTGARREMIAHPLESDDIESLCCHIESELSPENLHCDGEISPREAKHKAEALHRAYDELCQRYACVRELYV